MPSFSGFFASHRILFSRIFALLFFVALVITKNRLDDYLISDILFSVGLVLAALGTVGRLWCSLYISGHKNTELITEGPYSVSRNPLYFFSFLGFVGIACATEMLTFVLIALVIFPIIYALVIQHEEKFLRSKFGAAFDQYCTTTPRFFPQFSKFHEPATYSVNTKIFRRSMLDALWFIWMVGIIEFVEALHSKNYLNHCIQLW